MSGFAVGYSRDGAPIERQWLESFAATMGARGAAGLNIDLQGRLALAHLAGGTAPLPAGQKAAGRQPVRSLTRPLTLLLDGRIDNRADVVGDLCLDASEARSVGDAELALRAYEAWGESGLARLVGPLAVVVHEKWRNRLLLWRDPTGARGVYYHLDAQRLIAASESQAIAAQPQVGDEVDESRLLAMFAVAEPPLGATFFARVHELPPGHLLRVDSQQVSLQRWYHADMAPIRYRRDDEYAEHFGSLFDEAVRCRVPAAEPAALLVSGGLDSALLAAAAARVAPVPPLAVSWVFDQLASCDERDFSQPLAAALGLEHRTLCGDRAWPLSDFATWPRNPSTPEDTAYRRLHEAAYAAAADAGARVVLCGMFGDQLFLGSEAWWWSLLSAGRFGSAGIEALRDIRTRGLSGFARYAVAGPAYRRLARPGNVAETPRPWLTPRARRRASSFESASAIGDARRPEQARAVIGAHAAQGVVHESWHTVRAGVELRLPMRDLRLVDFMLRIPADQLDRPWRRRPIARNALRGRVPEPIRRRQDKTSLETLFRRGLTREQKTIRSLLDRPGAQWSRLVDRRWLFQTPLSSLEDWNETRLFVLWLVVCSEAWLARADSTLIQSENSLTVSA